VPKRDYVWSVKEKAKSRLGYYRLSDNYLRFYLRYIEPNKEKIEEKHFNLNSHLLWAPQLQFL